MIPPGATIGILGGGQLGRMLAIAAAKLGYRTRIYAPEASGPAADVSAAWTRADYADGAALAAFAAAVDVVTYEFENVDPHAIGFLQGLCPVRPSSFSLDIAQYRPNEKELVRSLGGVTASYREVSDRAALDRAIREIGAPAILKTSRFGYDGKGQARLAGPADADRAWNTIGSPTPRGSADAPAILERTVDFIAEFSVLLCRGADGAVAVWDTPENAHRDGILDISMVPARAEIVDQAPVAIALSRSIAEKLNHVGVLACEFFATLDGPVFNEMAPRVHNSGHWTIEGAVASQFENHVRAICGLPLGSTALAAPRVEMENLIGADVERWPAILAEEGAHLHLYGKHGARPGRKMGHVTRLLGGRGLAATRSP